MHQITIGKLTIDVDRKDIKNIHLAVYPPDGRVRIATPMQVDDDALRLFAISKMRWIRREQRKFATQIRETKREYIPAESHYFDGHRYLLNIVHHNAAPKVEIRSNKYLDLYIRKSATAEQRGQAIASWYRQHLKDRIPSLIEKWETRMNVQVNDWGIKQMKTKWGACNIEEKRIWVNLELAKKPIQCLEYIIVHEMTHLLVRHHNADFKKYLDEFMPHWRLVREELNRGILGFVEWKEELLVER